MIKKYVKYGLLAAAMCASNVVPIHAMREDPFVVPMQQESTELASPFNTIAVAQYIFRFCDAPSACNLAAVNKTLRECSHDFTEASQSIVGIIASYPRKIRVPNNRWQTLLNAIFVNGKYTDILDAHKKNYEAEREAAKLATELKVRDICDRWGQCLKGGCLVVCIFWVLEIVDGVLPFTTTQGFEEFVEEMTASWLCQDPAPSQGYPYGWTPHRNCDQNGWCKKRLGTWTYNGKAWTPRHIVSEQCDWCRSCKKSEGCWRRQAPFTRAVSCDLCFDDDNRYPDYATRIVDALGRASNRCQQSNDVRDAVQKAYNQSEEEIKKNT